MIPYKEIRKIIRFKLKDNNEVAFSDYEIKMAVNEVLRYLSISQALNNSDFLNKGYSYDDKRDEINYCVEGVELPRDFVTLISVRDHRGNLLEPCDSSEFPKHFQYKVSADRLYCGAHSFSLMYKAALAEIEDEEDVITLPELFKDTLVQLSLMILRQEDSDVMHIAAEEGIERIIPKRRYRNARVRLPFQVGGRRR